MFEQKLSTDYGWNAEKILEVVFLYILYHLPPLSIYIRTYSDLLELTLKKFSDVMIF